ncbi:hypothetical protein ACFQAT_15830 [Undibacterium arcticum]|uniref:hypothetical protein n=1 Tax=Undibacterium arcticum TaxID=1762892 RepID=UPI00362321FF
MMMRQAHKVFLEACRTAGVSVTDYPFNTVEKGQRALRNWIKTSFMEKYAIDYTRVSRGDSVANVMAHGTYEAGVLPDVPILPYSEWQLDEYDVDLATSFRFPALYGDWDELELSRFSGLRVVDTSTGVNLSEMTVFAAKPQVHDALQVLWLAIAGQHKRERLLNPDLKYDEGGGFPASEIPELQWVVPSTIKLDRALIHLANSLQVWIKECWGGEVKFGRPRDPTERASVESRISVIARRLLHQLPHTTYTGPTEARARKKATDADAPYIEAPLLAEAIHVYCANENASPMAGAGHIPPLTRLRRLVQSGAVHIAYLPESKRKAHFFSQPVQVKIRVELTRGRRPFFIFKGVRYSSTELQKRVSWKGKSMWVRPDHNDLRTLLLFKDTGEEFDVVRAQGRWGVIPHDARIRQMYQKLKRQGNWETCHRMVH